MPKKHRTNTEPTPKEKRLRNLKPAWKKGDPSPNPKGRPEGSRNFKTIIGEMFAIFANQEAKQDLVEINPSIKTNEDLFAAKILYDALNGDAVSKNIILDRYYGKVSDKTELSGNVDVNLDPSILAVAKILNERKRNKE